MFCPFRSTILVEYEVLMVPYSYEMVDMGGIDLGEVFSVNLPGIYERLSEAINSCGDVILYNWKFCGLQIAPSNWVSLQTEDGILLNGAILVDRTDNVIMLSGVNPPVIHSLTVNENGTYTVSEDVDGFNPVIVEVEPNLANLEANENGTYLPQDPYDGFGSVEVDVQPTLVNVTFNANGSYLPSSYNADGFGNVVVDVPSGPSTIIPSLIEERPYLSVSSGIISHTVSRNSQRVYLYYLQPGNYYFVTDVSVNITGSLNLTQEDVNNIVEIASVPAETAEVIASGSSLGATGRSVQNVTNASGFLFRVSSGAYGYLFTR